MKKQSNEATRELVQDIFMDENKKTISEETALLPEIIAEESMIIIFRAKYGKKIKLQNKKNLKNKNHGNNI